MLDKGNNNEQMIDGDVLRQCELLSAKNWGDEDITQDLEKLVEVLQKNLVVLRFFILPFFFLFLNQKKKFI